jgi:signal transduction histidine kinase
MVTAACNAAPIFPGKLLVAEDSRGGPKRYLSARLMDGMTVCDARRPRNAAKRRSVPRPRRVRVWSSLMDHVVRVLLVDDEARNLDVLETVLGNAGYELIRAQTGDDALRALLKHDVAAIVLDIRMPDVSGVELAQIIKSNQKFREIPILFLTAHLLEDQDVVAGYGAGAVDYLTKPINPAILRHKIAFFADLFRKTRALAELNETLETRVRERTAELERSEAALRAADRQKDEFLATLAHELRNPLAPLRMGLDLLTRTGSSDSHRTLTVMNRQLDHMVHLIDDLLDVARISGGKLELKKERVNVAETVQTALDTCRPFFEQRKQSVSAELDSRLFALADPTRLAQIVGNLLHNASKFTPDQGHVLVELTFQDGQALVGIKDDGSGIAEEQLGRVFDMFTRIDRPNARGNSGLGIGLALSRTLAEMHGGQLTASSPGVDQGSVFRLTLPAELGASVAGSERPAADADPSANAGVNVVVIEDNQDSAEVLAISLESRGFTVSVAHTGPAGLELVERVTPRIVLCDIGLPGMDGTEVCRRIRALSLGYRPVVVALTGWGMKEDVRRTRESGFDHHLVKPVAPDTLFALLDRVSAPAA